MGKNSNNVIVFYLSIKSNNLFQNLIIFLFIFQACNNIFEIDQIAKNKSLTLSINDRDDYFMTI